MGVRSSVPAWLESALESSGILIFLAVLALAAATPVAAVLGFDRTGTVVSPALAAFALRGAATLVSAVVGAGLSMMAGMELGRAGAVAFAVLASAAIAAAWLVPAAALLG